MTVIGVIIGIISLLTGIFGAFYVVIGVRGTFKPERTAPYAAPKKRIAVLIAARNEAKVVPQLIDSVKKQDYPPELCEVFVIPNNCDDDTEEVSRQAGASILKCPRPIHAKGEAISWAIDTLLAGETQFDGFLIVDADNLLAPNYLQEANNALCAGAHVAQGRRDSKNYADSWVAGCTSEFYWAMNRFYNKARNALGMSCALNGTGILLSADYMRKYGWHTTTLTEDLEFTAQCALNGERIWWLGDAVAYDEQPLSLRDSYRQRRRWSAGTVQCFKGYWLRLVKHAIKHRSLQSLDMAILFTGPLTQLLSLIPGVYTIITFIYKDGTFDTNALGILLIFGAVLCVLALLATALVSYAMLRVEKKPIKGNGRTIWMLWLFLLSWVPANLVSLVTRPPKWTQIEHTRSLTVEDIEKPRVSAAGAK